MDNLWLDALVLLGAVGFGLLQCFLLKKAVVHEPPMRWLFAVKLLLWAGALVGLSFASIPLLLLFTVGATVALLVSAFILYRREVRSSCSK